MNSKLLDNAEATRDERDKLLADLARLADLHPHCAAFDDQPGPCTCLDSEKAAHEQDTAEMHRLQGRLDAAIRERDEARAEIQDAYDAAVLRGAKPTTLHGRRKTLVELVTDALHSYLVTQSAFKNQCILTDREKAKVAALEKELSYHLMANSAEGGKRIAVLEKELAEFHAERDSHRVWRCSGQPCGACVKCYAALEAKVKVLREALTTIERSSTPGASILAKRDDGHACSWCRGMYTPCPAATAEKALAATEEEKP